MVVDFIPSVDRVDSLNELCDARIFAAEEDKVTLSQVASKNRERFPNLSMIVTIYKLINPQNMEVERGFSETDAILSI